MKAIEIEFTGAARAITGLKTIQLTLDNRASYRDIVQVLADRYPVLIGVLITADKRSFLSANLFDRNGDEPIMPDRMDDQPGNGDRLVVLYFIVGG
jgi:hypothetical protein